MKLDLSDKIKIPEGIQAKCEKGTVSVKGPKGEVTRDFSHKKVNIRAEGGFLIFSALKATKREKRMMGTFIAHVKNMLKGVQETYVYKLKVCASHFPITAEIKNNVIYVKNYLGEGIPRTARITPGVNVKVEGDIITVESPNKELAGMTASAIEEACKIFDKDRRVFQDGVFMILKAGKEIK